MVHIHHSGVVAVAHEIAFDYVDDYRNVPSWMFGLTMFEPAGKLVYGLGARFHAAMQIGPKTLRSLVEIADWEQNKRLTLTSVEGFRNSSTWAFEALGSNETRLTVDFSYGLPGGLAGRALGQILEPFVGQAIRHTENTMRSQLERTNCDQVPLSDRMG